MSPKRLECPECETLMSNSAQFCPGCGTPRTHVHERLERESSLTGKPYDELLKQARAEGLETATPEPLLGVTEYPFKVKTLQEQRFYHRLLNRQPSENALIEINNLLAGGIRPVSSDDIDQVADAYELNPHDEFDDEMREMYRNFLAYCYADDGLSAGNRRELDHLQKLLNLDSETVDRIHGDIALAVFERATRRALADRTMTPEEHASIESLQDTLNLSDQRASEVLQSRAQAALQQYVDEAVSDERLSPEEDQQIRQFAESVGADLTYDDETSTMLERFRQYWQIEHGELEEIPAGINLYKSEACYAAREAQWYEYRRKTRSIGYNGPTARIRIAKGLYWRAGSLGIDRQSEDVLTAVDRGKLFLTNKRLIFMGEKRSTTIRLNRVLDYRPYSNGIEIGKDAGKTPFFAFERDIDLFALTLERAIQDYG